jgi:hypothetical protein
MAKKTGYLKKRKKNQTRDNFDFHQENFAVMRSLAPIK